MAGFWAFQEYPYDINLDSCLDVLGPWLEDCSTTHFEYLPLSLPQLPTRVQDVSILRQGYIALAESSKSQYERYIALSHCWGEAQAITTVKANLGNDFSGIRVSELPRTFQEVALITSKLETRYL